MRSRRTSRTQSASVGRHDGGLVHGGAPWRRSRHGNPWAPFSRLRRTPPSRFDIQRASRHVGTEAGPTAAPSDPVFAHELCRRHESPVLKRGGIARAWPRRRVVPLPHTPRPRRGTPSARPRECCGSRSQGSWPGDVCQTRVLRPPCHEAGSWRRRAIGSPSHREGTGDPRVDPGGRQCLPSRPDRSQPTSSGSSAGA